MPYNIGALVLAAGFSSRFGSVKLSAELDNGLTILEQTLQRISTVIDPVIVVTRPELSNQIISRDIPVHIFDQAERGMGASLAYGISCIEHWDACLICLADMPFIEQHTYQVLANTLASNKIVIPTYGKKKGNPVGFGKKFFRELKMLTGDGGARPVIQQHSEDVVKVKTDDPAILWDIDTPPDLTLYQSRST
ncbi:MAG: nucleotidyltransferase family protein [Pseudomonadota bacterium]|nr:nucleotidyltransferase family protein [Pseudomonadota bacterium]